MAFYVVVVAVAFSAGFVAHALLIAPYMRSLHAAVAEARRRAHQAELRAADRSAPLPPFTYTPSRGDQRRAAMDYHPAGGRR